MTKDEEIKYLRNRLNEVLYENQAGRMFVRWFATEFGLATYGRKPEEMYPGKVGVGRWTGWFKSLLAKENNE